MHFYEITACYLFFGGLGVSIFLWGRPEGTSLLDRLHRLLCHRFPNSLKRALASCCGRGAPALLGWLWNYVFVQVLYLCVIVGGFLTFAVQGSPRLPDSLAGSVHKCFGCTVFGVCLAVWWRAKWFLSFLFWHFVLCLHGFGLGAALVCEVVVQKDLLKAVFVDPVARQRHQATYLLIGQYLLDIECTIVFVSLLALVMGLVLFGLFLWQLNLVRKGITTSEPFQCIHARWQMRPEAEDGSEELKKLVNIYNNGMIASFKEVFSNIDRDKQSGRESKKDQASAKGARDKKGKAKKS